MRCRDERGDCPMSKSIQDYLNLITSEHQKQPNFVATVSFSVAIPVQVQQLLDSMIPLFDLGTPPVGDQLDIIGKWVGVSRDIPIPIAGVFFTWDDTAATGWEFGSWQPLNQQTDITSLPDDVYLTLIRARIAANNWDGTTEGAYAIWAIVFPNLNLLIQDNEDMSFMIAISGMPIDSLTQALLVQGDLPLKPEGIRISEYVVSVDGNPFFAWDVQNIYLAGWGTGSWGASLTPL